MGTDAGVEDCIQRQSIVAEKNLQKETGYSGKTLISFGTKSRRGGGSVTLEYYHGSARILGEVRTVMRTR